MTTPIFLSIRGEGAVNVLEAFRRALGDEAASLVVQSTSDDNGYYGSADVTDVAAAREAFAIARRPYPMLKAFIGTGGRDESVSRLLSRSANGNLGRNAARGASVVAQAPRATSPAAEGGSPEQDGEQPPSRRRLRRRRGGRRKPEGGTQS